MQIVDVHPCPDDPPLVTCPSTPCLLPSGAQAAGRPGLSRDLPRHPLLCGRGCCRLSRQSQPPTGRGEQGHRGSLWVQQWPGARYKMHICFCSSFLFPQFSVSVSCCSSTMHVCTCKCMQSGLLVRFGIIACQLLEHSFSQTQSRIEQCPQLPGHYCFLTYLSSS